MLNRNKLLEQLELVAAQIFIENDKDLTNLHILWQRVITDSLLAQKCQSARVSWSLPSWNDSIYQTTIISAPRCYDLIAVDGSQIYPDRHSGAPCYLLNIGKIIFQYGKPKPVILQSQPYVFDGINSDIELSQDAINAQRQGLELYSGFDTANKMELNPNHLVLFDGSLIFWHLDKDIVLKEQFLPNYVGSLMSFYQKRILCASYISAPKGKELINIIRAYQCDFDESQRDIPNEVVSYIDAELMSLYLKKGERTNVFKNNAKISESYPSNLHPHFFYINNGIEIGRVEIPQWIAANTNLVDWVAAAIFDQSNKGFGYPIALAEAHEQAVIKGADRDFFYHLLQKMSISHQRRMQSSLKLTRKRGIGI